MALQDTQLPFDPAALDALSNYKGIGTIEYGSTVPPPPPPPPPLTVGQSAPGTETRAESVGQAGSEAPGTPMPDPLANPPMPFNGQLPSTATADNVDMGTPAGGMEYSVTPNMPVPPPKPLNAKQAAAVKAAQRENDLRTDPTAFAMNGNVVTGPSEQMKLEGGVADTQMQAYLAGVDANKVNAAREREKQGILLQIADKNYKEYSSEVESIDRNARQAIAGQQARAKEIASKTIQPHGVFNQKGALGGIMWALGMMAASQTKNSSQNMGMLMDAADAMINRDITAQKDNINNQWKAFEVDQQAAKDVYGLDVKGLANLATQQQVRYAMVEKALDMKIAQMGNPAAERAGLLNVKAAIGDKLAKTSMHFQDQIFTAGESAKQRANAIYLERMKLDGAAALEELKHKHTTEDAALENGVMTGEKTGLYATDAKGNQKFAVDQKGMIAKDEKGNPVPITIQAQKGKADELGKVFEGANKYYSNLKIIKDELSRMTATDLETGHYTDRYRAAVVEAAYAKALQINGSRPTDDDEKNGERIVQGFDPIGAGIVSNFAHTYLSKGNSADNMRAVVDANIAKLPGETVDSAKKFMRGDQVQNNSFIFKPIDLNVEPAKDTRTDAEVISGYTKDKSLVKAASDKIRTPMNKDAADAALATAAASPKTFQATLDSYKSAQLAGTLPKIAPKDQEFLDRATADMAKSEPGRVSMLYNAMQSGIKDGTIKISDEARFRLAMEAAAAYKENSKLVNQAGASGMFERANTGPAADAEDLGHAMFPNMVPKAMKLKEGEDYNDALTKFLASDEWQVEKRRLGVK